MRTFRFLGGWMQGISVGRGRAIAAKSGRGAWIASGGLALLGWLVMSGAAIAAEDVVFHYRVFERQISVADLETLAETGEPSRPLRYYLRRTNQSPETLQTQLTQTVEVNPRLLDRGLNSPLGGLLLDQLGTVLHTPSRTADRQALRAALVLSASDDSQVSTLELMQNYPTSELHVDGDRLETVYLQLVAFQEQWGWLLEL